MAGVRVEGAKELRKTLKAAGVDMKKLTALNREAAKTVVPVAKSLAPVGSPKNGHIRTTIRAGATQTAGIIRAGNKRMPYAGRLHWGLPSGFRDSAGRQMSAEAQPWLTIAARQTEPVWIQHYIDGLNKVLDSVKGK